MVWPFGRKSKSTQEELPIEELELQEETPESPNMEVLTKATETARELLAKYSHKKLPCPDRQLLAQNCVCMECPKRETCPMEKACRSTGCETNILTCSHFTHLTKNNGSVSEFGDVVMSVSTRRLVREYERDRDKIWREMKEQEEEDAKEKARREAALDLDGPWVSG